MFKEIMIDLGNVDSSGVNCKMVASKNVTSYEQHCQVPSSIWELSGMRKQKKELIHTKHGSFISVD